MNEEQRQPPPMWEEAMTMGAIVREKDALGAKEQYYVGGCYACKRRWPLPE